MISILKLNPAKVISLIFLSMGVFLLVQIAMPVINFEIWEIGQSFESNLITPQNSSGPKVLGVSIENRDNFPAFVSSLKRQTIPSFTKFTLSIPRLQIEKEDVLVDTNDMSKSLAHLPGSALPGEKGNIFISGHSALSQFFALKMAVFSKLPDLKKGDQIIIEALGSKFIYEVTGFKVVDPKDLSVINAPEGQGRYISLMTCVPPGLNFKRLVVLGKML